MRVYILKRNNQQSGPYTTQQLHNMGLLPTDQVRIAGSDIGWSFVDEIEELAPFVVSSSIVTPQGLVSKNDILNESPITGTGSIHVSPPASDIPTMHPWTKIQVNQEPVDKKADNNPKPAEPEQIAPSASAESTSKNEPVQGRTEKDIIEVIVTDDHWIFRDGVKMSLSTRKDIHIVGEAENGQQLLNLLKHRKADVILLDITMPTMDGLAALKALRRTDNQTKVIVLSMHEGRSMVSSMMEAGANGYLTKTADPESIYQAIRSAHEKGFYFSDLTNVSILEGLRHGAPPPRQTEPAPRPEPQSIHERQQFDEFNGGKILEKLAVSRTKDVKEKPRTSLQVALVTLASLIFLVAGIWGGFWLKAHPEWLRLNTLAPDKQETVVNPEPSRNDQPTAKEVPPATTPDNATQSTIGATDSTVDAQPAQNIVTSVPPSTDNAITTPVTNAVDKQKLLLEKKQAAKRAKDSLLKAQQAAALAKTEVRPSTSVEQNQAKPEAPVVTPKKVDISQVISQVSANANNYKVGVFGGLSKIEITVRNGSSVALDDVTIEVSYISASENVFQTKILHTGPMGASSAVVVPAPSSNRGARIEWRISQVNPKD